MESHENERWANGGKIWSFYWIRHLFHLYIESVPLGSAAMYAGVHTSNYYGSSRRLPWNHRRSCRPSHSWFCTHNSNLTQTTSYVIATNFAHVTTAMLSWHVQNFLAITVLEFEWELNLFPIKFANLAWKVIGRMVPWMSIIWSEFTHRCPCRVRTR